MTSKFFGIFLLVLVSSVANADDRVGHFDVVELLKDDGTDQISVKAPDSLSSGWVLTLPGNDGNANQCLITDGSGVTSWAGPYALAGSNSDITALTGLTTRLNSGVGFITGESTYSGNGCYLFSETGNDTGICSPSDGLISVYGNATIGAQISSNGISQIRGVDYVWPSGQASGEKVLTNDGSGNLSWGASGAGLLNISDTYDSQPGGSNRNNIDQSITPTGDSTNYVSTLYLTTDVEADYDVGGVRGVDIYTNSQQVGDVQNNTSINSGQSVGSDSSTTTTDFVQVFSGNVNVGEMAEVGSLNGVSLNYNGPSGSNVTDVRAFSLYGTVDTNSNFYSAFEVGNHINNVNHATVFNIYPTIGTQAEAHGWQTYKDATSFTTLDSFIEFGSYVNGTTVRGDWNFVDSGNNITTVGRNLNLLNFHDNFNSVNAYYNGYTDNSHISTVVGGDVTGMSISFRADSIPGDGNGIRISPTVTQRADASEVVDLTVVADVAGSLAGKYFRKCSAYGENPNTCYKFWYSVGGSGTAPSADGDTLVEIALDEDDDANTVAGETATGVDGTAKLSATATDDVVEITTDASGRSGGLDTATSGFSWAYLQGGGGDGTFRGISFGGGNITGYDEGHIIAFDSGGYPVNFGQMNAYKQSTITASLDGNPIMGHVINSDLSLGDGETVANADSIGVGGIGAVTVGDGTTVTSGFLGVGATAQGKISLITVGSGSSIENTTSDIAIQVFQGGSGTITNSTSYRAATANFGASGTMVNYRAFFADDITGAVATNSWGLYAKPVHHNWAGGDLKIGGTSGSTDKVANNSVGLEVEGKALYMKPMTSTARDGLTALEGMFVENATNVRTERYDGTAWVANDGRVVLNNTKASPSAVVAASGIAIQPKRGRQMTYVVGDSAPTIVIADPPITGCDSSDVTAGITFIIAGTDDTNTVTLNSGSNLEIQSLWVGGAGDKIELICEEDGVVSEVSRNN